MRGCAASYSVHTLPESAFLRRNRASSSLCINGKITSISCNPHFIPLCLSFKTFFTTSQSKKENKFKCGSSFSLDSNNGFESNSPFDEEEEEEEDEDYDYDEDDFIVVNFYQFVYIQNPEDEVSKHLSFLQGFNIHGRIYINEQGINAQFSGPVKDSLRYVKWLKQDPKFSNIFVQISPSFDSHAFPRLKLRYKPSLVQFEGGISNLPLLESSMRAIPLTPNEWKEKLLRNSGKGFVLLDVRNGYEWDIGHFNGAKRPNVDCFRTTSFGLSESDYISKLSNSIVELDDPLFGIDKEKTGILMYCTGGIRCDVYSLILRQRGYTNLYTLKGGVSNYLKNEGSIGWTGNLFVFDSRLSLPPSTYKPEAFVNGGEGGSDDGSKFARCYICELQRVNELRHRNCANLDCNLLFLCCKNCMEQLRGCCCSNCTSAPRLRPVLPGHQRYKKWHIYRDSELQKDSVA